MILEKVRDDATVRRKICQSSALRLKRGPHDLHAAPKCEVGGDTVASLLPQSSSTTTTTTLGPCSLKPEELELCLLSNRSSQANKEERLEDVASPDSLSEVSQVWKWAPPPLRFDKWMKMEKMTWGHVNLKKVHTALCYGWRFDAFSQNGMKLCVFEVHHMSCGGCVWSAATCISTLYAILKGSVQNWSNRSFCNIKLISFSEIERTTAFLNKCFATFCRGLKYPCYKPCKSYCPMSSFGPISHVLIWSHFPCPRPVQFPAQTWASSPTSTLRCTSPPRRTPATSGSRSWESAPCSWTSWQRRCRPLVRHWNTHRKQPTCHL